MPRMRKLDSLEDEVADPPSTQKLLGVTIAWKFSPQKRFGGALVGIW